MASSYNVRFRSFLCFMFHIGFSVEVNLLFHGYVYVHLPGKSVNPKMTYGILY